ncbi:MAG: DUF1127 domain-containing protein [Magnetospiraceae bacterium]
MNQIYAEVFALNTPSRAARSQGFTAILEILSQWGQRYRTRRALARLDDRLAKDIGFSRADIVQEIDKPFWQA